MQKKYFYLPTYPIFFGPLQETNNFFFLGLNQNSSSDCDSDCTLVGEQTPIWWRSFVDEEDQPIWLLGP